ncbi:His Kinase A (phospho-acceptor) domain-containing protein [Enhydrobacter aerosaccus]|uniref:histidine kinase n=1 Tax=Enhydrobacter aerosaccus TaxID=225324 RepID=A0A1T4LWT9_9HYPH|nr:response regulator [Enhydrobacter aerosaccus]SJZ59145.1 His Kinase A (phospho-acceptor) domain-containing protein [Enhydrobacter aerosaccus]
MGGTDRENRVLVLAPIGRDGPASAELLRGARIEALVCADLATLIEEIAAGAGAVFVAEEGLFRQDTAPLARQIARQPAWSDLPFIVLTSHQEQPAVTAWRRNLIEVLRNVSLLERPVQPITFASTIQSALRARRRQYEVRALIQAREQAAQELEGLVVERTRALADANRQLRAEMEERAQVEDTLRQAQKIEAIGQLTGGIAHDFNNLLMVISGGLEMLDRPTDPARQRRLRDGMIHAARRGAALTRQLLAFSRRQELRPESVDIASQIARMRELLDRSLGGHVHVEVDMPDTLWPVEVDPGQLELVVLNLAVNARDAMPNGGTIVIRGENLPDIEDPELGGDYVRLSVIDTGIGMAPEIQARVFEPYFTTKGVGKGSGLGLAQVHGFASQSRGAVRIDSEVGRGTRISLYLPKADRPPADAPHVPRRASGDRRRPHEAGCILLVEDDDEVAALTGEMLDQLGYEVTRTASAVAALGALANGRRVDLVFSDVMMPGGMTGLDLAREIRRRHADLPVLLTSGYADTAAQEATAEGIHLLPKPYQLGQLAAALRAARSRAADGHQT